MTRRGLTLLEVLLAVVAVSLLAAVVAGLATDLRSASSARSRTAAIDHAALLAGRAMTGVSQPLRAWPVGRSETTVDGVRLTRAACPDCPKGFGRFEIESGGVALTRFAEVAALTEIDEHPVQTPGGSGAGR